MVTIISVIAISGCTAQSEPNKRMFGDREFTFRANLTDAASVPIYPDEMTLLQTLYNPDVTWVYIAYIPNDTDNGFYTVSGYELSYKLVYGYKSLFGYTPAVRALPLNATPEQPGNDTVIIWMRAPSSGANETAVTVDGNIIMVDGADMSEETRTYTDLDKAADRLLLSFLWPPTD